MRGNLEGSHRLSPKFEEGCFSKGPTKEVDALVIALSLLKERAQDLVSNIIMLGLSKVEDVFVAICFYTEKRPTRSSLKNQNRWRLNNYNQ